jgi:phosphatidylserine/phosphatidylglycerophosphate/cardiolipin synthase-like enzyme
VVDGVLAFLGSQNFDWRSLEHVREIGVRMARPELAAFYQKVFDADWALCGAHTLDAALKALPEGKAVNPFEIKEGEGAPVVVLPVASPVTLSPLKDAWDLERILVSLKAAQQDVVVEVLTYSIEDYGGHGAKWLELDNALREAAGRGVRVRLLVSDWNKRFPSVKGVQGLAAVKNIEARFITIPQAEGKFIPFARVVHAKFMVVDGRLSWVGSSNWEKSYFYSARNVGLWVQDAAFAATLMKVFEKDWGSGYTEPVDPAAKYKPPRISK